VYFRLLMASNTRASRRAVVSAQPDIAALDSLQRLILAQAVYELGANAWSAVAKLLTKHPLLSRHKSLFTPQVGTLLVFSDAYVLNCLPSRVM
jgi:hypothetical protein